MTPDQPKTNEDIREELRQRYQNAPKADLEAEAAATADRLQQRLDAQRRVNAALAPNGKRIRRNALCPCDSGLKFKQCCLGKIKTKIHQSMTKEPQS